MTQLDTKPVLDDGIDSQWPPLAHIVRTAGGDVKEGDRALCGAKLMGIDLPDARKVCKKCVEIAKRIG